MVQDVNIAFISNFNICGDAVRGAVEYSLKKSHAVTVEIIRNIK
jgi:hypothetical protein